MNLVKTPFLNLTLLTFCVAGILWLICRAIYPLRDIAENTQGYLIPALIVILCIELYLIKDYTSKIFINTSKNDIRISGIMLLDDKEVCLGGGYQSTITSPTIAIQNPEIVSFFRENFITYCQKSKCICNEGVIDWSTFIEHEKRALSLKDVSPSANSTTSTG